MNECLLEPGKLCTQCGECDRCDLDKHKICDNCGRCLGDADYSGVQIDQIILPQDIKFKYRKKRK